MKSNSVLEGSRSLPFSLDAPAELDDQQLLEEVKRLVRHRRALSAELLVYLAEVDRRRLYLEHATSSMFAYCTERLGLPEPTAYKYIRVARLAREVPLVLEFVAEGRVHLTGLKLLAPYVQPENARELLAAAAGKSKRGIEQLLAERFPRPDAPSMLRKLPEPKRQSTRETANAREPESVAAPPPDGKCDRFATLADTPSTSAAPSAQHPRPHRSPKPTLEPLATERYKVQFTASRSLHDKLRQAQALLRPQVPDGDLAHICERAVDLLLAELRRRKFAQSKKTACDEARAQQRRAVPKPKAPPVARRRARSRRRSRHIPNAVKRAVFERDGLRCTFVDAQGRRCTETGGLEFHHRKPFGRGGSSTVDNVELRCRAHNRHAAERDYGAEHVQACIERERNHERESPD